MPGVYAKIIDSYKNVGKEYEAGQYEKELKEKYPKTKEAEGKTQDSDIVFVSDPTPAPAKIIVEDTGSNEKTYFFTIQIAALTSKKFTDAAVSKYEKKGYDVYVKKSGKFYKIQIGRFETRKEAEKAASALSKKEKIKNYLIKQGYY